MSATQQKKMSGPGTQAMRAKPEEEWDEEQLQQALKQLKLLHIKCQELRADEVFQGLLKSVQAARSEIKDFGDLYNSDESQRVLSQAKKSREANPRDIKPWRAKDDPHWFDLDT
ncbi:hypothetical protein DL766_000476 [Monosporascus sp. MC13-8B]|uniref:Uncharacterized protein n=1 Tax=Monosporascus cannonballus TaxID=155416 RepID=A0ABY0GQR9_9PEZI|nr:hypothetical protein DL762_010423 [Monosporascus cannonballus]RYO89640.1 hypothetical protein DL763_005590 [Monosporascus cannonballus]RYP39218.1 hypothetical protein DL766_000476 [Monosporascus sp. MC13-8B]